MRALKAILVCAAKLKRISTEAEDILILKSLMDINLPKLKSSDIGIFMRLISSDLFPFVELPENEKVNNELYKSIAEEITKLKLMPEPDFIDKCLQLHDTLKVRHGIIISSILNNIVLISFF